MNGNQTLTLYVRAGCHLCDDMLQQLGSVQQQYDFSLNIVDIDADSFLKLRYGERVPVLAEGEKEICHYYFNQEAIVTYLQNN